ncbi:LamG-like jellyroll fold domain-containing protein [Luteolibacter marinus]|uniref:LamG-like jellyroll fold domain-containing protein n=1 Tax=Luteolibacter marinus TaxID=2776705 RepID=UPI001867C5B0|nr:LamG-like jellyroll fold domain-containing protein [Luteolibacter marinus]
MSGDEMEREIQLLIDGDLPPERVAALYRTLGDDPAARELYYDCVALHQALGYRLSRGSGSRTQSTAVEAGLHRQRRRSVQLSLVTAAAAVLVAAFILRAVMTETPAALAHLNEAPGTIYTLDARGDEPADRARLDEDTIVTLTQGTLEVSLATGSRAMIQAPARFSLASPQDLRLDHGSAFFHIVPADHGFTVTTRAFKVTDLGTEFGIHAGNDANHEVHVLKGKVSVTTFGGKTMSEELEAGQARDANAVGQLQLIPPDPAAFLTELPPALPELHFGFEPAPGSAIPVSGTLPKAARIKASYRNGTGNVTPPTLVPGKVGSALSLKGDGDFVETDWQGIDGDLPRSVSFWTKVAPGTPFTHMPAVANWGEPRGAFTKWKVMLAQETPDQPVVARISLGVVSYDGATHLDDGQWHHFVAVFSGAEGLEENFAIYIDGRREPLKRRQFAPIDAPDEKDRPDTVTVSNASRPLLIGLSVDPRPGSFPGLIDELRIHAGALSEQAVQRLYADGQGQ